MKIITKTQLETIVSACSRLRPDGSSDYWTGRGLMAIVGLLVAVLAARNLWWR